MIGILDLEEEMSMPTRKVEFFFVLLEMRPCYFKICILHCCAMGNGDVLHILYTLHTAHYDFSCIFLSSLDSQAHLAFLDVLH